MFGKVWIFPDVNHMRMCCENSLRLWLSHLVDIQGFNLQGFYLWLSTLCWWRGFTSGSRSADENVILEQEYRVVGPRFTERQQCYRCQLGCKSLLSGTLAVAVEREECYIFHTNISHTVWTDDLQSLVICCLLMALMILKSLAAFKDLGRKRHAGLISPSLANIKIDQDITVPTDVTELSTVISTGRHCTG